MTKLRIKEVIVVEGKYDAAKLSNIVDALIITTDGFSVFSKTETKELIKKLGAQRGLIILTDSDAAGFKIRNYINNFAAGLPIKNAYIPALSGKEARKPFASKEGLLGVEGVDSQIILQALLNAGANGVSALNNSISYTDLYNLGLSGSKNCAEKRYAVLKKLGIPSRVSKKALCDILSSLYTYEELEKLCEIKPVIFWDFHGTLTLPDGIWYDAALQALKKAGCEQCPNREELRLAFYSSEMPWWKNEKAAACFCKEEWWSFHENELYKIYFSCNVQKSYAEKAVKHLRPIIMDKKTHRLQNDAVRVLKVLKERGYRQNILSSNFPYLESLIIDLDIRCYFDNIICSGDIGYDKPSSEFYNFGLNVADINAENAIMIGDNPQNDIQPALSAGMKTIAVNRACGTPNSTWSCERIEDILNILL